MEENTKEDINQQIQSEIQESIQYYQEASPASILGRINELDREWDTERVLEANASSLVVIGSVLSLFVNRKWSLLPIIVGSFLFQHATQGWCPPLSIIRRAGIRTSSEIQKEKQALLNIYHKIKVENASPR
ncbi:YgaP family membrane protein [Alteribacillus iranensis]|uniref:DUF2892 domain-containing protein n=1 Tax=Alteribacillus iranensis TaxID=930128 RepID=A0A1I2E390_9BACI|nr:DUF2892 domain-containing protein [Alteribacillus iranensis]SFE87028.1 Protein of unknown function [Alteribacillus iranensis]